LTDQKYNYRYLIFIMAYFLLIIKEFTKIIFMKNFIRVKLPIVQETIFY